MISTIGVAGMLRQAKARMVCSDSRARGAAEGVEVKGVSRS